MLDIIKKKEAEGYTAEGFKKDLKWDMLKEWFVDILVFAKDNFMYWSSNKQLFFGIRLEKIILKWYSILLMELGGRIVLDLLLDIILSKNKV